MNKSKLDDYIQSFKIILTNKGEE